MADGKAKRLFRVWDILVERARNGKTITYEELGKQVSATGNLGLFITGDLDDIEAECVKMRIPRLNAVVVNKATGQTGSGFTGDADKEREVMSAYPGIFERVKNPFTTN